MKIDIKFAEVHTPLFMGGVNFGVKLTKGHREMKLIYDRDNEELHIFHNDHVGIIPKANVAIMVPSNPQDLGYPATKIETPKNIVEQPIHRSPGRPKAQVSHPVETAVFGAPK